MSDVEEDHLFQTDTPPPSPVEVRQPPEEDPPHVVAALANLPPGTEVVYWLVGPPEFLGYSEEEGVYYALP